MTREAPAPHPGRQTMREREAPMTDDRLNRVLATGVTEAEIAEPGAVDVDMFDYASAREAGATHAEVLEVAEVGYDLCDYYAHLRSGEGATHAEAMVKVQATATLLDTRHEATVATAERLVVLAGHEDYMVRLSVALNPDTPPEPLATLAKDRWTRAAVAANPSTPPGVLTKLAGYKAWTVRKEILANPSAPPEALARLAEHEAGYWAARGEPDRAHSASQAVRRAAGVAPEPPMPSEADQLQL